MTELTVDGNRVPVTLLKFLDQEIIRLKTLEKDGYNAIVIGAGKIEKDGKTEYTYIKEFKVDNINDYKVGDKITLDMLKPDTLISLKGKSKGKGFQGVIKRFGFSGGPATHGSQFHRHPGSIGNMKPRRVNKNHPLPGHMGYRNVTLKNVRIISTHSIDGQNIVVVKGSVPGARNSLLKAYLQ